MYSAVKLKKSDFFTYKLPLTLKLVSTMARNTRSDRSSQKETDVTPVAVNLTEVCPAPTSTALLHDTASRTIHDRGIYSKLLLCFQSANLI